ncbi:hypothetical protein IWX76_001744 [Pedobacter sp. CAN_A7]
MIKKSGLTIKHLYLAILIVFFAYHSGYAIGQFMYFIGA